jgi:acetyl esterase/lipase
VSADPTVLRDLVFATPGGIELALDLYLPADRTAAPVCVYLHGGGWLRGARTDRAAERLLPVARAGVAVASVDYRLSGQAVFPAQLDDVRAAVRWLRAHAGEHGLDATRVGAWGASAGGHLAALAGLTRDERDGELGDSSVQAVVAWFATTDLLGLAADPPEGPPPPFLPGPLPQPPFEARLLGVGAAADAPELARAASPVAHAHAGAPPFLLAHGDSDGLVPSAQSRRLHAALRAAGADATLWLLAGGNHEDPAFDRPESLAAVAAFLRGRLAG